ncbi:PREDICTED: CBS domain-containing protein CBSCBSPB5-like [Tarenaya hassleriana]|uniref:CBS domain-containing protein CBSCBSPB5-like n=1 Tax=Tarenaya hassleriana TaxID=28532 RepID=UPI00053C66EF|nr:PREDICTED: CBS domain-containing protein CBSCBSPB5-like [Tarenaya hassleriana]XP_010555552.1 PREDICTED: CBS domain-containing protein CBSCBSPB5-like [Tarenaya hassleriana]XP_010555553.1 PREDICTED: CBS domain-containing protein CBSCBSPB5-like [Tarenaya hassleriana]XP_010555554.1 PREDICTED: CBS domain-containing protein CBSCBSPB5-like [Tarenaya hassleriana]XP_010555555.1 PREDICTED: CBS domain-containing protein CBSCBSPB5-like [Tarenaya hassleriana]
MANQGGSSRKSLSFSGNSFQGRKKASENEGGSSDLPSRRSLTPSRSSMSLTGERSGERTVKRLRLSKALTVPDSTTLHEACRRMAARRVDALLLTDSNALLCGILTDRDIATRVIARELNREETPVSKVMTKNPVFVLSDTIAVEALQKMVQGKFRHLPVVENGEVIALLDIAKCLYDAIARMERAAEKGKAIAAAVEGVEKNWGTSASGPSTFIETLREQIFRPSLSTIIPENSKVLKVGLDETVLAVTKKMVEFQLSSAVVMTGNKLQGILTSKDILMRIIAQNLPPDSTTVEKVMTSNPESVTVDTSIVDALHIMHDGKFLHLPVVDKDGDVIAVIDVIHITQAAVTTAGSMAGISNETANSMMQKFWDSAMALPPNDDEDESRSEEGSMKLSSEIDAGKSFSYSKTFTFKIQDKKGRMHRFMCETQSLTNLITAILQRMGDDIDPDRLPQIMYEDEDHDQVMLASDSDLSAAVEHAKAIGWKGLKLHLDYTKRRGDERVSSSETMGYEHSNSWAAAYRTVAAGAALAAGLGVLVYLKRHGN